MIYGLQKKFVRIAASSLLLVFSAILLMIYILIQQQLNQAMDTFTDMISGNKGRFPDFESTTPPINQGLQMPELITRESQFSTRFFTVQMNAEGRVETETMGLGFISSVDEEQAEKYAQKVMEEKNERGWVDQYRYKVYQNGKGVGIVFVDGSMNRSMTQMMLLRVGGVLIGSFLMILILIVILSKRAVKPIAESYEKQKQFVTNASHELKTPLTLILTNVDIAEEEVGKNEWLEDARSEGERMNLLINQLVMLSKIDEENMELPMEEFELSRQVETVVKDFTVLAEEKGCGILAQIEPKVLYNGSPESIRQLLSILLDNAIKYCDIPGEICVSVAKKRHIRIRIENTYRSVEQVELGRLFERFYRADEARTFNGGFGVGLSIAKTIVEKHKGEIKAYRSGTEKIGFEVLLK